MNTFDAEHQYEQIIQNEAAIGLTVPLTYDDFCLLMAMPCHYCNHEEIAAIHRLDKYSPYQLSNCVPICDKCNHIKVYYHPSYLNQKPKIVYEQEKWTTYYSKNRIPLKVYNNLMIFS